jgi:hypothetical protein
MLHEDLGGMLLERVEGGIGCDRKESLADRL